jgi:glycosyltransferase involved in cell wall biosynthesis
MHSGGFAAWVSRLHPEHPVAIVHAAGDGQEQAYPDTADVPQITYDDTVFNLPVPLLFITRAIKGAHLRLPLAEHDVLIAGAHFLPDVWPVARHGKRRQHVRRAVYIHHIIQDMPRGRGLNTLLANLQEKWCFWLIKHRFTHIITVNQEVVQSLRQRGFKQPILVSSNFVNNGGLAPMALSKKDFALVFVGRMVKQKGVYDFIDLCEKLMATQLEFRAVMVGVGPELDRLKEIAAAKNLPITFAGLASEAKKFDYLRRAKLFVFPSIEEGWGIVVAESLSVGTPVLAYNLPVYGQVFGDHLYTVPQGDTDALAAEAARLLNNIGANPGKYAHEQKALAEYAAIYQLDRVASAEYAFLTQGVEA